MKIEPILVQCTLILGYYDDEGHCRRTTDEPAAVVHWPHGEQLEQWIEQRVLVRQRESESRESLTGTVDTNGSKTDEENEETSPRPTPAHARGRTR